MPAGICAVLANGSPAFCKSRTGNEFWVMLLEKAFAKLHGGYQYLKGAESQVLGLAAFVCLLLRPAIMTHYGFAFGV